MAIWMLPARKFADSICWIPKYSDVKDWPYVAWTLKMYPPAGSRPSASSDAAETLDWTGCIDPDRYREAVRLCGYCWSGNWNERVALG